MPRENECPDMLAPVALIALATKAIVGIDESLQQLSEAKMRLLIERRRLLELGITNDVVLNPELSPRLFQHGLNLVA